MAKKYKLLSKKMMTFPCTSDTVMSNWLYRIQAVRDIPAHNVKAGDLGGWVSGRKVLSHDGDCWIGGEAVVYIDFWDGVCRVLGNALITDDAVICAQSRARISIRDEAIIKNNATIFIHNYNEPVNIYGHAMLSENAVIENPAKISGKIGGYSMVSLSSVLGQAQVDGRARVSRSSIFDAARVLDDAIVTFSKISGCAVISDDANIFTAEVRGNATVSRQARVLEKAVVCDSAQVTGSVVVRQEVVISGESVIKDNSVVSEGARILGKSVISGDARLDANKTYTDFISADSNSILAASDHKGLTEAILPVKAIVSGIERTYLRLDGLEQEISAYGNDIVKLLKFPIMNDMRDENTLEMMLALKNTKMIDPEVNPDEFCEAVNLLERKFMKAESNALIIASTVFSDEQRKKADKARDLFAIACNEVSSEQEKKNAFKQGFRQLEGVVAVKDSAIENMRIRVGIPELEA